MEREREGEREREREGEIDILCFLTRMIYKNIIALIICNVIDSKENLKEELLYFLPLYFLISSAIIFLSVHVYVEINHKETFLSLCIIYVQFTLIF